ncbi:Maf family nucleotide pyrophosphatase [Deinococcus cavernae]|uniref:Maf family nucleotide pyrophosphatase n=1 Tax=Deinococcus cavernae TaxID=2320857 RepID=UPI001F2CEBA0|nr:Maf family nucleotide pyrophosphatase [Deinococcus cavernae]
MPEGSEKTRRVILASGSPRRRELLSNLGVKFEVLVSGEDEDSPETNPQKLAGDLALLKARSVAKLHPDAVVIAADTVVACAGELLAKPADALENAAFIRTLAGKTHQVFTGVTVLSPSGTFSGVERTDVEFRPLTEQEIQFYARSGEGLDKAGGYGIQGVGMGLVARVNGDYSNIVGFPLALVMRLLRRAGVPVWDDLTGATDLQGATRA